MYFGKPLVEWLRSSGVETHPSVHLTPTRETGTSYYAFEPLLRDTTVIRVPKSLCITSDSARQHIQHLIKYLGCAETSLDEDGLSAPDWILLYLVLTRLGNEWLYTESQAKEELEVVLRHMPYASWIPETIETPLHFSPAELALLASTPLLGSTERRLRETMVDYERARTLLLPFLETSTHALAAFLLESLSPPPTSQKQDDPLMAQNYHKALELWRWAESAFTSRSFPPRLIGLSDSNTTPILIPGYDIFNHARAYPVTWICVPAAETQPNDQGESKGRREAMVHLTINYDIPEAHTQIWNNYGGKSNEEFLSGYGFTLDNVSEDTLALKLGGRDEGKTHYWHLSASTASSDETRSGFVKSPCPCPSLLVELEQKLHPASSCPPSPSDELELYATVLETLESLLLAKRKSFRASQAHIESLPLPHTDEQDHNKPQGWHRSSSSSSTHSSASYRYSVCKNIAQYRRGQLHLLNHAVQWTRTELERVADALDA